MKTKKKTPSIPHEERYAYKYDPDRTPLDYFLLAKEGHCSEAICKGLGVSNTTLNEWLKTKPAMQYAQQQVESITKGGSGVSNFQEYVYKRLPEELQDVWDQIEMWHDHPSALVRLESIFAERPVRVRQSMFFHALIHCNFNASEACRMVGMSKSGLDRWIKEDPDFPRLLDEIQWHKKNYFEGGLIKLVKQGNVLATIFANRTANKDRGYGEKVEVNHTGAVQVDVAFSIDELELPLEVRVQVLEAIRAKKALAADNTAPALANGRKEEAINISARRVLDDDDEETEEEK